MSILALLMLLPYEGLILLHILSLVTMYNVVKFAYVVIALCSCTFMVNRNILRTSRLFSCMYLL